MSKDQIQNYQIIKVIGKGTCGIVYKAQHKKTKEIVAIKQIEIGNLEGIYKQYTLKLLESEISITKSIKHKHIVELKEIHQNQNTINLILEYCAEGDLAKFIKKNSPTRRLPESEAKPIILQLIDAVKFLHSNKIVHRDLKLENILINEQLQIKLADFGWAKSLNSNELLQTYCGTLITMAPEILNRHANPYNQNCDIWSLGVIIYQILFDQSPFVFQKGTAEDLLRVIKNNQLQFPSHISVSADCKDMLRKLLVEDPKNRMSFEDIMKHPWLYSEQVVLGKSVLKVNVPYHQDFIRDLQYSINQYKQQLTQVVTCIQSIENKYKDLAQPCQRFKNILNGAFSTFNLKIYYSNQSVSIKVPENYQYFNYQQELLLFLISLYEIALQNQINIQEFINLNIFQFQICNHLMVVYQDYTVTLFDELKNFKQKNAENCSMLQFVNYKENDNKILNSDLQILTECIIERCKN